MEFGSEFVYLGNDLEDEEEVVVSNIDGVVLSDSDSDDSAVDGEVCLLDILDTAGQEEYSTQRDKYVNSADGFVIIYSITDKDSFSQAKSIFLWLKHMTQINPFAILVANKQDLSSEAVVTSREGTFLAQFLGMPFYEVSAKAGTGVVEALTGLIKIIPRVSTDYKIVMLGGGAVGKSSITLRFVSNSFIENYDPTIEDSYRKMILVKGLKPLNKELRKAFKKKKKISTDIFQSYARPVSRESLQLKLKTLLYCGEYLRSADMVRTVADSSAETSKGPITLDIKEEATNVCNKIKVKKTDGNVVLIPLRILEDEPHLMTGDPINCAGCLAVLTGTAELETEGDTKKWTCEFCGHQNCGLEISENEIPKGASFDFMLSPPTKSMADNTGAEVFKKKKNASQSVTVYCMDVSGSMQELCHVPSSHVAWREARTHGAESGYNVTRLDCLKNAIRRSTEQLKLEEPQKQVLLTVFSSNFCVKAGGRAEGPHFENLENLLYIEELLRFEYLEDLSYKELLEMGQTLSRNYQLNTIEESHELIDIAVTDLEATGCTALGPALTICVGYVKEKPGSEIVLCTDGLPNVGIGNIGYRPVGNDFYRKIGTYARSRNITINILAVGNSSSELQAVSAAAELSGGLTCRLNPVEILRQLRLISQNEVIATSVSVRFYLHPDFVFDEIDFGDNLSRLEKEVGNVRMETDITFRFKLRDPTEEKKPSYVPFQVQITYTRKDGMICLRVLSYSIPATNNRKEMEENIHVSVLGVTTMKATAKMAQANKPTDAQHLVKNMKRLVRRGAHSDEQLEEGLAFKNEVESWDCMLTNQNSRFLALNLDDSASNAIHANRSAPAYNMSSVESKMPVVQNRKRTTQSSDAYYDYKDDL